MPFVATLIAHPSNPILSSKVGEAAASAVSASGLYWLCDGVACDIALPDGGSLEDIKSTISSMIGNLPIDLAIQDAEKRRKKLLIADMDSTMIEQECIDELAAEVGLKDKVAEITARAMNGELDFEFALRERVGLLKGLSLDVVDEVIKNRISLMSGGKALVATMKHNGAYCALVSGGFTVFTGPISKEIGFDEHRSNLLLDKEGILTGDVGEPILGKQAKVDALNDISERIGITPEEAIAVGDGANDLGMLQLAGSGVALHAKPMVAEQAKIKLDHSDLTALLYLQGYRKVDFID